MHGYRECTDRDGEGGPALRLRGINHIATVTSDMDRLQQFYKETFDAELLGDMKEHGLRHSFISLGPDTFLHPYEIDGNEQANTSLPAFERGRLDHLALGPDTFLHPYEIAGNEQANTSLPAFERGRLDHLALNAATRADFDEMKGRLIAAGASDGTITDYGTMLSVFFRDPDGMECELCWNKDQP